MIATLNGDSFYVDMNVTNVEPCLPKGNYLIQFDKKRQCYCLKKTSDFVLPPKIYGDTKEIERYLRSYKENSHKNMGVLLLGDKGSGKTIMAQRLAILSEMPVLFVSSELIFDEELIEFLSNPAFYNTVLFFDEFEKLMDKNKESGTLASFFDGNISTRYLLLLTANSINGFENLYINRPGRIKYLKHFKTLDAETTNFIIDDLLVNKNHKDGIFKVLRKYNVNSIDILISLVRDMNLFNDDAETAASYLNIQPQNIKYELKKIDPDGKVFGCNQSMNQELFYYMLNSDDFCGGYYVFGYGTQMAHIEIDSEEMSILSKSEEEIVFSHNAYPDSKFIITRLEGSSLLI